MRKHVVVIMTLVASIWLVGCSGNVSKAKDLPLPGHTDTTVGKVFDNFDHCEKKKWSEQESPQGEKYVEFTCIYLNAEESERIIRAYLDDSRKRYSDFREEEVKPSIEMSKADQYYKVQFPIDRNGNVRMGYTGLEIVWSDGKTSVPTHAGALCNTFYANDMPKPLGIHLMMGLERWHRSKTPL